jgi:hypothetical protein
MTKREQARYNSSNRQKKPKKLNLLARNAVYPQSYPQAPRDQRLL